MRKYILFPIILVLFLLSSCGESFPPDTGDDYIPTIIYRVERFDTTLPVTCPTIEYINEDGDTITLTDVSLPWEYRMNVEDNDFVSLHIVHAQTPIASGTAAGSSDLFLLDDLSASFTSWPETSTVLNVSASLLCQISNINSDTQLRLNLDTFDGGEAYEIYDRLYYISGIYRLDQTGIEVPLASTAQLYYSMDETLTSSAYK
ncbi:MAG: hypothetical protein JXJ04_07185 [Spirochaetales bacterium]|nr:hypothetical protein [Spirochaetales bacterium]